MGGPLFCQRLTAKFWRCFGAALIGMCAATGAFAREVPIVVFETSLGTIEIEMLVNNAPLNVQNFRNYVDGGDYDNTFIHRSVPGFVVQGGGYVYQAADNTAPHISTDPPVVNEFGVSNVRGTVAMAKLGGNPDSATSEFFFNLGDNNDPDDPNSLDNQNGGFTVFGVVLTGMDVVDAIAILPRANLGGAFSDVPTIDYDGGELTDAIFVKIITAYSSTLLDTDNDGFFDRDDTDDDNDDVDDGDDAFPLDANETVDTDSDGTGNNADPDDDNDGVADEDDAFPLDAAENADADGDGTGDVADVDDDNDGVDDGDDAFPLDPAESADLDGDEIGDNADTDDDGDGVPDFSDAFPRDATESVDTDGDGIGNNLDTDDDGDGISDADDPEPLDGTQNADHAPRLTNISTRASIRLGDEVLIGGLVIAGDSPKTVLLRARGPSLEDAGITSALQDPLLQLFDVTGALLASNDSWQSHPAATSVPVAFQPNRPDEAAILITLPPGSYTAIASGPEGQVGIGIVEVFEVSETGSIRLFNISTRGYVGNGDDVLIGGVIISGDAPHTVTIRARGPSMASVAPGLAGRLLEDPLLQLFDATGTMIDSNYNWQAHDSVTQLPAGLEPTEALEAVITRTLSPGAYTAIVRSADDQPGIGIVEVIEVQ